MSNWFSDHPATSVISHTILVASVVWAVSYFILDERKISNLKAEVEIQKATAEMWKTRSESQEQQQALLLDENKKYLEWLTATPKSFPYLEQKIKNLTEAINQMKITGQGKITTEDDIISGTATIGMPTYTTVKTLNIGEGWVDPKTNVTFGIGRIMPDFSVSAVLGLPGKKTQELKQVKAGDNWTFVKNSKSYQLTVSKIDWFTNKAEIILNEIEDAAKK